MSKLAKLLRRRASERLELDWQVVAADELATMPELLDDLLGGRRDGATITGVLDPEEAAAAAAGLNRIPEPERREHLFGWLVGMSIGMIGGDTDRTPYIEDTERVRPMITEAFGFDPHERIAERLAPVASGRPLVPASESGRDYNPGQVRWFLPNMGGLPAHVGNEFRVQLEHGAMQHLLSTTAVLNHLSYFLVLQRASSGGELRVYDLTFTENQGRNDWGDSFPDDSWIESVPSTDLDPGPGDLILFGGGWRWHRVEPTRGDLPRITYGGFVAESVDGTELHFWS